GSRQAFDFDDLLRSADDKARGTIKRFGRRGNAHIGGKEAVVGRECVSAISRRDAPEVCESSGPSKNEGAGKTGCALHPRSRVQYVQKKRTRAYRFSGDTPA